MLVSDFDYELPPELIAQEPVPQRDQSRMLVLDRTTGAIQDHRFPEIVELLRPGDLLVLNDTKVLPARLYGTDWQGRRIELLLLRELEPGVWEALSRPSRKAKPGVRLSYGEEWAEILDWGEAGVRKVRFSTPDVTGLLKRKGEVPLPPYIHRPLDDTTRYQTVYARREGAVAAPTAGLHFTPAVLEALPAKGVNLAYVTLHAGLGTFRPVKAETVEQHAMYREELELSPESAQLVNDAKGKGGRVVAAGTTVTRALEAQARRTASENKRLAWQVVSGHGLTDLFIYPGYEFRIVDAMLTNFHLPRSTLLMLVAAFAGRELTLRAYEHAIADRYRFYSLGDAMLII